MMFFIMMDNFELVAIIIYWSYFEALFSIIYASESYNCVEISLIKLNNKQVMKVSRCARQMRKTTFGNRSFGRSTIEPKPPIIKAGVKWQHWARDVTTWVITNSVGPIWNS